MTPLRSSRIQTLILLACVGSLGLFTHKNAFAGGLDFPENTSKGLARSGASTASAQDPTALWFNPAGLAHARGSQTNLDIQFSKLNSRFTRSSFEYDAASSSLVGRNDFDPVTNQENPFIAPFLATSYDFGRDDFALGIGVFGPHAHGRRNYPVDGPNRYMIVSSDVLMAYYTLGVAWKPTKKFSIGASVQWVDLLPSQYGVVVNMPLQELTGLPTAATEQSASDVLFELDVTDRFTPTAVFGLWYQAHPRLEIAFSTRPLPVHLEGRGTFELTPQGPTMTNILETMLQVNDKSVGLDLSLPAWFRGGFRYRHLNENGKELWDIEVDFVYEMWSVLQDFDVTLGSDFEIILGADGEPSPLTVDPIKLPKKYKDTYSLRLGSTIYISDALDIHGGAFFESAASPKAYTHLDFTASERLGLTTGLTYKSDSYEISLAYGHIFQPTRTVSAEETMVYQLHPVSPCKPPYEENCHSGNPGKPPGVPAGGGTFESGFHVWSAGVTMFFGGDP